MKNSFVFLFYIERTREKTLLCVFYLIGEHLGNSSCFCFMVGEHVRKLQVLVTIGWSSSVIV